MFTAGIVSLWTKLLFTVGMVSLTVDNIGSNWCFSVGYEPLALNNKIVSVGMVLLWTTEGLGDDYAPNWPNCWLGASSSEQHNTLLMFTVGCGRLALNSKVYYLKFTVVVMDCIEHWGGLPCLLVCVDYWWCWVWISSSEEQNTVGNIHLSGCLCGYRLQIHGPLALSNRLFTSSSSGQQKILLVNMQLNPVVALSEDCDFFFVACHQYLCVLVMDIWVGKYWS